MRRTASLFLFIALSAGAAFVETPSGRRISGTRISADETGTVTLVTSGGQKMVFRKGRYRRAVADKPRELAQAEKLIEAGETRQAEALLKKVEADFRFLFRDQQAARLLAGIYYDAGKFEEAAEELRRLENPTPADRLLYREALFRAGDHNALAPLLEEDLHSESRATVARAYLLRGDIRAARGDPAGARRDWLKAATFFRAQEGIAAEAEQRLAKPKAPPRRDTR